MEWIYNEKDIIKNFFKTRGFNSQEEIDNYLNFTADKLRTKYLDSDKVVSRLTQAIENKENIVVYGDYDCDGICATTIVLLALRNIGVNVNYFINDRFLEGYGMNEKGISRLLETYPETDLIFTCDNGINAQEGIELALDACVDVICSDHHLQKGDIIVPTVDEWRNDEDALLNEQCCGAEIARRIMYLLYKEMNKDTDYVEKLIAFSGIATVADVVNFTAANRYIVKRALELLNTSTFSIINLIKSVMQLDEIDEDTLGFKLGPLMNAFSRVTGSSNEIVEILTSSANTMDVYEKVKQAVELNETRKQMCMDNLTIAKQQLNENDECIILKGDYDLGINGLVCSNLVEMYNRPCIILTDMGNCLKGSARSYLDFNLKKALDECSDLLLAYGGHAGAAGLTLKEENLQAFKEKMCSIVRSSQIHEKEKQIAVDYECSVSNMFDDTVQTLMSFAPFGEGFPKPHIAYCGKYKSLTLMPKESPKHVSFLLKDNEKECKTVWWNAYEKWSALAIEPTDDIAVLATPKIDTFNGKNYRKLYVEDIKII